MLSSLEKQTILSALRNGLGLTHACYGLHRSVKDVSDFIRATSAFELECNQSAIMGYQTMLVAMNDAQNRKAWDRWKTSRVYIDQFVTSLNLWECLGTPASWTFMAIVSGIKKCKTVAETATAFGFSIQDFQLKLYEDTKLVTWLIQNGFQI